LQAFFSSNAPLIVIPGDPDANPANYAGVQMVNNKPMRMKVFLGMRVTFTHNICKQLDYVNGMSGTVRGASPHGVLVETDTGYIVTVYPWTDEFGCTYFPCRLGYAQTLLKVQGATLANATFYLDVPGIEAAGYVALSRVRTDADWKFVGNLTTDHFVPARLY
jgi:hypothetical protein